MFFCFQEQLIFEWYRFLKHFSGILSDKHLNDTLYVQKQPPRDVPRKRFSTNMQQIYRKTPMPKCCNF